jgi:outer membrane protein TolC
VVLELAALRTAERQAALFRDSLVPRAELLARDAGAGFSSGRAGLQDLIMAQRALLEARLTLVELAAEREKALAGLESWSLVDIETLEHPRLGVPAGLAP